MHAASQAPTCLFALALSLAVQQASASVHVGVDFPAGVISFADRVVAYEPEYGGGPAPDVTQQDARQILGVPEQGEVSLGHGGRITVQFVDNSLVPGGDSAPDLWTFETGSPEITHVEISKDGRIWYSVGTTAGLGSGIDIDQFGFDASDAFSYVRLTDDRDLPINNFQSGADLTAVGASSSGPPVSRPPVIEYQIQAQISGRSQLIISGSTMQ